MTYPTVSLLPFLQLRVAQLVRDYPIQCERLFLTKEQEQLTAVQFYDLFVPCFSPEGSNAKEKEVEAMGYWMTFLEECEGTLNSMSVQTMTLLCCREQPFSIQLLLLVHV